MNNPRWEPIYMEHEDLLKYGIVKRHTIPELGLDFAMTTDCLWWEWSSKEERWYITTITNIYNKIRITCESNDT